MTSGLNPLASAARGVARMAVLMIALAVLQGCAQVAPWERGTLARRDMSVAPNPALSGLRDHMHVSKEAAQGGHQGVSGGCGCN